MAAENSVILSKIGRETHFLRRRKLLTALLCAFAVFVVPVLVVTLFDLNWPFREPAALTDRKSVV